MNPSPPSTAFTGEQQNYLTGFMAGLRTLQQSPFLGQTATGAFTHDPVQAIEPEGETVFGTPLDELSREELIKHEQNGLDCWDTIVSHAASNRFAEGGDVFRFKYHGLFYVNPAQDAYMLRCRIPGCVLSSSQLRGLAGIAQDCGGGYADLTTRGNLQIREIQPPDTVKVLTSLVDLGLTSKGAGADNVRNITATPTSGFDPEELIDVLPYARAMHHYILNHRDLYGLPRKFNISYDSGGAVSVCADTNDIAFYACRVPEGTPGIEPGVYFRMQLCGITGHKQFAQDSGVLLTPAETIPVAAALIRVFIEHGDRTNRRKARLKYLVDRWGIAKTLEETRKKLAFPLRTLALDACEPGRPKVRHGHLGVHRQSDGRNYLGVVVPVGRMTSAQMEHLAAIAERFGTGELRLTVWQNLLIPHVPDALVEPAKEALLAARFHHTTTSVRGGLVACTGNTGCKFAATNTKGQAIELANYLESRLTLDQPLNIHLTGCPHSCAQHYVGDIGLMGVKVKGPDGQSEEGYTVVLGGGVDDNQFIAREAFKGVPFRELPALLERLLRVYLEHRQDRESFAHFTRRQDLHHILDLFQSAA